MFDFLSGVLDGVESLGFFLYDIVAAVIGVIVKLWQIIAAIFHYIWDVLVAIAKFLAKVAVATAHFVANTWDWIKNTAVPKIVCAIGDAHQWIEDHLCPVICFIKHVRRIIDDIYRTYIRPILQVIQTIRRVLFVFRLLGFKWAAALDKRLAAIENDINKGFIKVRGYLNYALSYLEGISSPKFLARTIANLVGGRRVLAGLVRLWTGLPIGHFWPSYATGALPYERAPSSANDLLSPITNPPASQLFAVWSDMPTLDFSTPESEPTDTQIDGLDVIDLHDLVFESYVLADALQADQPALVSLVEALDTGSGAVNDAADAVAGSVDESLISLPF